MFNNVSGKLKAVAKIYFWVMLVIYGGGGLALGIYGLVEEEATIAVPGLVLLVLMPFCNLIVSWVLHGFAEIIENTRGEGVVASVEVSQPKAPVVKKEKKVKVISKDQEMILADLLAKGLISQTEFNEKVYGKK